jgi:hypothetical protein
VKRIYKVKFIDDGDERTMEAVLRGILRAKEEMRPKVEGPGTPVVQGPLRRVLLPETLLTTEGFSSTMEVRHLGPGDHPSGSPQSVHGGDGGGSAPSGGGSGPAAGGGWRSGSGDKEIASAFVQARALVPPERQGYLSQTSSEEIASSGYRGFLSTSGRSGFMLTPEGEIQNLFSTEHAGAAALEEAIREGGTRLDCFDGFLPRFYERFGFREVRREPNWTPGGPDVVYMERAQ